ncbi:MAG: hypothetical protein JSS61_00500 [Verrucomicrobia bacterium]|nr:hypothetical protein [Verrucomicrobiota bacterium]
MSISIKARQHLFSHQFGTRFLLPGSHLAVCIFPALIRGEAFSCHLGIVGPVHSFTAELNLEKGHLTVFGKTARGFLRYVAKAIEGGIEIGFERVPQEMLVCRHSLSSKTFCVKKGGTLFIPIETSFGKSGCTERLSLGLHKAQDWDPIRQRLDFKEIFPYWLKMAQQIPQCGEKTLSLMDPLLEECAEAVRGRKKNQILPAFEKLFLAAFEGVFVPRAADTEFQGIVPPSDEAGMPIHLLKGAGDLIRSLFIEEQGGEVAILPCLPPGFVAGRYCSFRTEQGDAISIEWTKGFLRQVEIRLAGEQLRLKLPKEVARFRMRAQGQKRGELVLAKPHVDLVVKGSVYLDRFEG